MTQTDRKLPEQLGQLSENETLVHVPILALSKGITIVLSATLV